MIVYALGLHGSASTWLYNVIRSVLDRGLGGAEGVASPNWAAAETRLTRRARNYVVKGHIIEPPTLWLAAAAGVRFVYSVRDPRDAAFSLMSRLGGSEASCAVEIVRSIASLGTAAAACPGLAFAYETRFFESAEAIHRIARFLDVDFREEEAAGIFDKYRPEAVRRFVATMDSIEPHRRILDEAGRVVGDHVTMFNHRHIGTGESGRWREFREPFRAAIDAAFSGVGDATVLRPGMTLRFGELLFSPLELPDPDPYEPRRNGPGIQLLRHCFLPTGIWRIRLAGALPLAPKKAALMVTQSGRTIFEAPYRQDATGMGAVEFVHEQRNHEHPLAAFVTDYDVGNQSPIRAGAFEMTAVCERPPG
ncbi:MAG: hypothetical protein J0H94_20940 [Rhizobiales bacterium]|nr:hypothetical protein [Hyphomicrobiales bacterium]